MALAADMEIYCQQRGIRCHASSGLALTYCILAVLCIIPYVGLLIALVELVLVFILYHQFTSTAVEILHFRMARQPQGQWG